MIEIFGAEAWYRQRPEKEVRLQGVLKERQATTGPAGRAALSYSLVTPEEIIPVYAGSVGDRLVPLVGQAVQVTGKLVDLSAEGFGQELWIASIEIGIS